MIGTVIDGRYRLERELRRDSDLVAYAARDERLQRDVVVKVVQPERAADATFLQAYRDAVSRASRLSHPGIMPVLDSDLQGPTPFVVESAVGGPSLAERLEGRERLSPAQIRRLADQCAAALAAAHAAGVVHGAISPAVIYTDAEGDVRLSDFARPVPAVPSLEQVRYEAPEQALGSPADARSDVYSLAATLYHAIDGQPPFDGPDRTAINLSKISSTPRPLEAVAPELPPAMLRTIEGSLVANPGERPANGSVLRDRFSAAAPVPATPTTVGPTVALSETQVMPRADVAPRRTVPRPATPPPVYDEPAEPEPRTGMLGWLGFLLVVGLVAILYFAIRHPSAPAGPPVPSVVGKTEDEALKALKDAGLNGVVTKREPSDTVGDGRVIDQLPAGGGPLTDPTQKQVTMTVSTGPRYVTVPSVTGMTEAQAKRTLPKYGLSADVESTKDPTFPDGQVISQSPRAGAQADKGSAVTLIVNHVPKTTTPPDKGTPPGAVPPANPPTDNGPVGDLSDAAKQAAGDAASKVGEKLKQDAEQTIDQAATKAREGLKQKREEIKKGITDWLHGKDNGKGTPDKGANTP